MIDEKNIQQILEEIDKRTYLFSTKMLGEDILTKEQKKFLTDKGVDLTKYLEKYPTYKREYMWGRLSTLLGEANAKKVKYKNFTKWLNSRGYTPLTVWEKKAYEASKKATYKHITGIGDQIKGTIKGVFNDRQEFIPRSKYEKIIKDEVSKGVYNRETAAQVASAIGHKTDEWSRNLGRIAETEMNNVYQLGKYHQIIEKEGENALIYKDVYSGACKHCIRLFLTNGIGSRPIVFKAEELAENGTNVGRKVKDWKPTICSIHPYCRCTTNYLPKGMVWDDELKMFDYPKKYKSKSDLKITIKIGDQIFKV